MNNDLSSDSDYDDGYAAELQETLEKDAKDFKLNSIVKHNLFGPEKTDAVINKVRIRNINK